MTSREAPLLESRTVDQVIDEVRRRANISRNDALGEALLRIFGRYFEIVSTRLNRAPEKHRLVFLDLLGTRPSPPAAARVPLTFYPVQQLAQIARASGPDGAAPGRAVVPARTQVAASAAGAGEPPVFETERSFELTSATLARVLAHDPATDMVGDYSDIAAATGPGVRPFEDGMRPALHEFYLAWPDTFDENVSAITLHFDIEPGSADSGARQVLAWSIPGEPSTRLAPFADTTGGLVATGEVTFGAFGVWPVQTLNGVEARWLRCRLESGLRAQGRGSDERTRRLPGLRAIEMSGRIDVRDKAPELGFFNAQALDLSTGFYPLGFSPRFGDLFYLSSPLFARPGAEIALRIELANTLPDPRDTGELSLVPLDRPPLVWEAVSAGRWVAVECDDATRGLARSGTVRFKLPRNAGVTAVNGIEAGWIRARMASITPRDPVHASPSIVEPGREAPPFPPVAPFVPAIERVRVDASSILPRIAIHSIVRVDDVAATRLNIQPTAPMPPFRPIATDEKALYFGLHGTSDLATGTAVFVFVREGSDGSLTSSGNGGRISRAEYWNGSRWAAAHVSDDTHGLTRTGAVAWHSERPWHSGAFDGSELYWMRLIAPAGRVSDAGPLTRVALNTVMAVNAFSIENELLGSSDNAPNQLYTCARRPVVGEVRLEVREKGVAPAESIASPRASARQAVTPSEALPSDEATQRWVAWTAVDSFSESGPEDRHFVVDPWTGTVRFGDGRTGMIPPAGPNNIRMRRYRSGGGAAGNVPAGSVTEARSTVAYVSAVTNLAPATGGSDPEHVDRIARRGSAWLRHRDRAVTREDYEDLAAALPGIARARALPSRDLAADPDGRRVSPGHVSVIVVPEERDAAPKPTSAQLRQVHDTLASRKPPGIALTVVAPSYVRIDVTARLSCDDEADFAQLAAECRARLGRYLHPLTGGSEHDGWRFGVRPTQAALNALLQGVEGVRQVRSLEIGLREERPGLLQSGLYLICPGRCDVVCIEGWRAVPASP